MVGPTQVKTFHSLTIFSLKSPSSSTLTFTKLKTLVHTLIYTHLRHIIRAFAKTKSILNELLNKIQLIRIISNLKKNDNEKSRHCFGSFRFHYNWGSSHIQSLPPHVLNECHVYYDPAWKSFVAAEFDDVAEAGLSGYLHWLEEQGNEDSRLSSNDQKDEIDKLADMFIASCHEKFKLEKEESYRKYQEMMARSV